MKLLLLCKFEKHWNTILLHFLYSYTVVAYAIVCKMSFVAHLVTHSTHT